MVGDVNVNSSVINSKCSQDDWLAGWMYTVRTKRLFIAVSGRGVTWWLAVSCRCAAVDRAGCDLAVSSAVALPDARPAIHSTELLRKTGVSTDYGVPGPHD